MEYSIVESGFDNIRLLNVIDRNNTATYIINDFKKGIYPSVAFVNNRSVSNCDTNWKGVKRKLSESDKTVLKTFDAYVKKLSLDYKMSV